MYKNGCQTNYESGCDKSFSENENIFPVNKNTRADSIKTKSVRKKQISVEKGKTKIPHQIGIYYTIQQIHFCYYNE
jgi:hypothetical protein